MKSLSENRKAAYDYEILETFEAGIVLDGQEVKSIKYGKANLVGSFVIIKPEGALLLNAQIPPYQPNNIYKKYDPARTRRLLLHKDQIKYLFGKSKEGGLTIVPLKLYNNKQKIKVLVGLARHKKKHDKRETIKRRETEREMKKRLIAKG